MDRKKQANHILYDLGLLEKLNKYGSTHIIGSYIMDLMVWNDIDIYVENEHMSLHKLHQLTSQILNEFFPTWLEAKETVDENENIVYFLGFEFYLDKELWNIDIWFLNKLKIDEAEKYCADIFEKTQINKKLKNAIISLKKALINMNLYSFDKYTSMDVYDAVINKNIMTLDDFIANYKNI